ncbi:hypothetical protein GUJ93_ZPchr0001g30896 [Zizania palustris]|uniref:Uncharacterized protein n=1 Tax=Zizania palustris TaxID=103762 RepID=A0A8J5V9F8_ZIZPA|nr:hypothetical protein GUJ93_ZPchr0001g30896 [Zizania palustris]
MEAPDEEAGLGIPEDERILEVTLISSQGLKSPSGLRPAMAVAAGVRRDHRLLSRPVGSPSTFAVGVRRPSGRVHGLLNVAASLVVAPPSPAASYSLRLSPAVSLSDLSKAPIPGRVLRVHNRSLPTPPPSPKVLTPKIQQIAAKPNKRGADKQDLAVKLNNNGADDGSSEESREMGGPLLASSLVESALPNRSLAIEEPKQTLASVTILDIQKALVVHAAISGLILSCDGFKFPTVFFLQVSD